MKLFYSKDVLSGAGYENIPAGINRFVMVRFTGVNKAGQTLTRADLGRVIVNKAVGGGNQASSDKINSSVLLMSYLGDLKGGVAEFTSAVGAAFTCSIFLPFYAWWDLTRGMFFADKQGSISLDFPVLASGGTVVASGTVECFYVEGQGVATYDTYHIQRNIQAGGAGSVPQEVGFRNISSLYFYDDALVTRYFVDTDRGPVFKSVSRGALRAESNWLNQVETATDLMEARLNPYHDITNNLNSVTNVLIDATAAVNLNVLVEIYEPTALVQSSLISPPPPPVKVPVVSTAERAVQ
jgi:hypothetical protein